MANKVSQITVGSNIYKMKDNNMRNIIAGIKTAGNGSAYTATVGAISSLTAGISFIMIPHTVSTTTTPTLNVNSLGAKPLRRLSISTDNTNSILAGPNTSWLTANVPVTVYYNGSTWVITSCTALDPQSLSTIAIGNGGTGATTATAAITALGIKDYVIETGTTGSSPTWLYRKWKSGKIECWGNKSFNLCTNAHSVTGGVYWETASTSSTYTLTLPSGFFSELPNCMLTADKYVKPHFLKGTSTTSQLNIGFSRSATGSDKTSTSVSGVTVYAYLWIN